MHIERLKQVFQIPFRFIQAKELGRALPRGIPTAKSFFASWACSTHVMESLRQYFASKWHVTVFFTLVLLLMQVQPALSAEESLVVESPKNLSTAIITPSNSSKTSEERYRLPFLKMRELVNAIYDHKPLTSLRYTFESKHYGTMGFNSASLGSHDIFKHFTNCFSCHCPDEPLIAGEFRNLSFKHLGPFLHNESSQSSWIGVMVRIILASSI